MKLAIIGASLGQMKLCQKAKEMGLELYCFAWEKGAVCKDIVDKFYPISIMETDRIVNICQKEGVEGVVSNASDLTAETTAYISEQLGLNGNSVRTIQNIRNKSWVRAQTNSIEGLSPIEYTLYDGSSPSHFPCIIKPILGSSKDGVSFSSDDKEFHEAIRYSKESSSLLIIEHFIDGKEYSVETLSYHGAHYIIQFTEKKTTGAPHFVELEHHQPADLSPELKSRISILITKILSCVGYQNGAAHVEIKIDNHNNIYLIELNPRGGGDRISDSLIKLSTGYDYLQGIIDISLDRFSPPELFHYKISYAGIYYLCLQTKHLLPFFNDKDLANSIVEQRIDGAELTEAHGNTDRNGYLIYCGKQKVNLC